MDPDVIYKWFPITEKSAATREVVGPISGPNNVDYDQQIVDVNFLRRKIGPWFQFGNIRQQHDRLKPIGKASTVDMNTPDGVPVVRATIVSDEAWKLAEAGVLSGFSVGIKNARIISDPMAVKGRIIDGDIIEISLVDHPANPQAQVSICKMIGGSLMDSQHPGIGFDTSPAEPLIVPVTVSGDAWGADLAPQDFNGEDMAKFAAFLSKSATPVAGTGIAAMRDEGPRPMNPFEVMVQQPSILKDAQTPPMATPPAPVAPAPTQSRHGAPPASWDTVTRGDTFMAKAADPEPATADADPTPQAPTTAKLGDNDGDEMSAPATAAPSRTHSHSHRHGNLRHTHPHTHAQPAMFENTGPDIQHSDHQGKHCGECGRDSRICGHNAAMKGAEMDTDPDVELTKGDSDFNAWQRADPIHPGNPNLGGGSVPHGSQDGMQTESGGNPSNQQATVFSHIRSQINAMARTLDGLEQGNFNPNKMPSGRGEYNIYGRRVDGDPMIRGENPDSEWAWHGGNSWNAPTTPPAPAHNPALKGAEADQDMIQKAIQDGVVSTLRTIFGDDGLLTKSADPDSTKTIVIDGIAKIAAAAVGGYIREINERLVKVESEPAPSKGFAIGVPIEKFGSLSQPERQLVEESLLTKSTALPEDQRLNAVADWRSGLAPVAMPYHRR